MKKYVIRSIGWVFDDDWYNYDGEHDIEGIYSSKKEAKEKVKHLNHKSFVSYFFLLSRFQVNYGDRFIYNDKPIFVDVKNIASFLSKKLDMKEEEILQKYNKLNDADYIIERITIDLVDQILEENNFAFFKIFEFETDKIFFYYFKKNPTVWIDTVDSYHKEEDYYFYDERPAGDTKRAVKTIKECYEYAFHDSYMSILHPLLNRALIKGELSDLSNTPHLLQNLILNSPNIEYATEKKNLNFKRGLTVEEIMSLDTLLIHPILLQEKVEITSLIKSKS